MNSNGRRLIRPHIDAYRAALTEARADLNALHAAHERRQIEAQRRQQNLVDELEALRHELSELKSVIRARQRAQAELDGLYRERELMRALAAPRDPALPLN
jgi:chromosome segregation ATPase